jgi:hypothetical protein
MERRDVMPSDRVNGILRPCCIGENLQTLSRFSPEHRHGMIVRQCRVCGRKHYELVCDAGTMGVRGAGL